MTPVDGQWCRQRKLGPVCMLTLFLLSCWFSITTVIPFSASCLRGGLELLSSGHPPDSASQTPMLLAIPLYFREDCHSTLGQSRLFMSSSSWCKGIHLSLSLKCIPSRREKTMKFSCGVKGNNICMKISYGAKLVSARYIINAQETSTPTKHSLYEHLIKELLSGTTDLLPLRFACSCLEHPGLCSEWVSFLNDLWLGASHSFSKHSWGS